MSSADSMQIYDYLVLAGYFALMVGIGIWSSRRIKKQVDFFMGGRSFGKLLQTFAAFGAGTGSADPVNTARTAFVSGLSGMWSVMYWLFVTPFYWITGVWYRRMRLLTLGDWFVERYESQALGLGYCIFGLGFFMFYGSLLFTAIGKVAAPLVGIDAVIVLGVTIPLEYLLVPLIGLIVMIYGILGGLEAAYYTDLIQGLCIILLSVILIPFGLFALVEAFGDPATQSLWSGFTIMHQQLPDEYFSVVGATNSSEFPWYRVLAIVLINLVGIVVQPHFIATGGGSAKTETSARVGLVTGNFLKRFCTIGWVLTALIILALYGANPELNADPDRTWGFASLKLLPVGLKGLMLACLLAALMSSADAYMVIGSALVVRNIYSPYFNPNATEGQYVFVGRITGAIVIMGAVVLSLFMMDVFGQLQLTWIFGVLFAAPFWVGMYWRRATTLAAWGTVIFNALFIFLVPMLLPIFYPALRGMQEYTPANHIVITTTSRPVAKTDVERRHEWKKSYEKAIGKDNEEAMKDLGKIGVAKTYLSADGKEFQDWSKRYKQALKSNDAAKIKLVGLPPDSATWHKAHDQLKTKDKNDQKSILKQMGKIQEIEKTGGASIFWSGGVTVVGEDGQPLKPDQIKYKIVEEAQVNEDTRQITKNYGETVHLRGNGDFKIDFLLYRWMGLDLTGMTNAQLATLDLPTKIVLPFLVMILLSFITPRNKKEALDRYYAKMKTPVDPDPQTDQQNLDGAFANPEQFEAKKLFPGTSLEFQKPTATDIIGFVLSFILCFVIIALAVWVANIGG